MPSANAIEDALAAVLLQVDGIDYVLQGFRGGGKVYERDIARVRVMGPPAVTEQIGHRIERHRVEVLIVVGRSDNDVEQKMELANARMTEAVALIEAKSNASLGGIVNNTRVGSHDDGVGLFRLDSTGDHVAAKLTVETDGLEQYRA